MRTIKHTKCQIEGCNGIGSASKKEGGRYFKKGYCNKHYKRFKKYGCPFIGGISGHSKHPLYVTYKAMKARCLNENNPRYKDYGGRGITVYNRWLGDNGFKNFIEDMVEKPTPQHSLDRIDNDKGYSKENCRWATTRQQVYNRRCSAKTIGVCYVSDRNKWLAFLIVNGVQVLSMRFKNYEDAVAARKEAEVKYGIAI